MTTSPHPQGAIPAECIARQAAYFRELAELGMLAARTAGTRIQHADAADGDTSAPTLDLARATRTVIQAATAETGLFRATPPPRAPASDTRRAPLRHALVEAATTEPNPVVRATLIRQVDALIEQVLVADPDAETPIVEHLCFIGNALDLPCDPAKLRDDVLGPIPDPPPW